MSDAERKPIVLVAITEGKNTRQLLHSATLIRAKGGEVLSFQEGWSAIIFAGNEDAAAKVSLIEGIARVERLENLSL